MGRKHIYHPGSAREVPILFTQKLKKNGYLINISVSQLFAAIVVFVMPDIFQILTGFRGSLMILTGSPRAGDAANLLI